VARMVSPMVTQIEIPPRVRPDGDSGYLEELTKAIFRELAGDRVRIEFVHGARTGTAVLCSMSIPRRGRAWRRS